MERDLTRGALAQRVEESETRIAKVVAPGTTNIYDTLFGGILLSWMDEIAFITAARFGRCPFVTVSIDRTDFKHPIPSRSIVELVGRVEHLGTTSLKVRVDVFIEHMLTSDRTHAVTGLFSMVAIGEDQRPIPIKVR
ncbi:MAG TPA: acyl-CoA thioesterase [Candidatus Krumholzibacteria bacterium]|nr:acyl-CoA thioesterase [Candidatus Krumholzibacteria bacterium]